MLVTTYQVTLKSTSLLLGHNRRIYRRSHRNKKIHPLSLYANCIDLPAVTVFTEYLQDVYNKVDSISLEQVDKIARQPNSLVISCEMDLKYVFQLCLQTRNEYSQV